MNFKSKIRLIHFIHSFSNHILSYLKKEKYILLASLFSGILFTIFLCGYTKVYSENVTKDIANQLIRFHVLANSDTDNDQALKLKVRDGIISMLSDELKASKSKEETKQMINANMDRIIAKAEEIIASEGYSYPVKARVETSYFPTKTYGDISLPAGEYEALRIVIGNGEGHNWWCVMFPPLCFVDVSMKEAPVEDKQILQSNLTSDEYDLLTGTDSIDVKVKFKIIELWNEHSHNA